MSDESATHFTVNLALSKYTADPLGFFVGYTVQFTHQGVTFGVLAFNGGPAFGGWSYSNGFVNFDSGEVENATEASGTFTPGSPALLSIQFDKALFPHGNGADNKLVGFKAGTADFKAPMPVWIVQGTSGVDVPAEPPFTVCDLAEGTGTYAFQVGGHAQHGSGAMGGSGSAGGNATAPPTATTTTQGGGANLNASANGGAGDGDEKGAPGPGAALVLAAVGVALLAARRRRA